MLKNRSAYCELFFFTLFPRRGALPFELTSTLLVLGCDIGSADCSTLGGAGSSLISWSDRCVLDFLLALIGSSEICAVFCCDRVLIVCCFSRVARGLTTVSAGFSMKWGLASSPLRLFTISSATAFSDVYAGPVEASVGGFLSSRGGFWLFVIYLSRHLNNSFTYPATDKCSILLLRWNTWSTYAQYISNDKW